MSGYFLSLIALTFVGGGVLMLAPDGGAKSGMRLLCSLCAIACILLPFGSLLSHGELDVDYIADRFAYKDESELSYDEIYNSNLTRADLKNIENLLKSQVISRFDVKSKAFDIKLIAEINSDEYFISSATLVLYPSGLATDPRPICIYISEVLSCECDVYYSS